MKIGFACKYMHPDRSLKTSELKKLEEPYNMRTTTVKWCKDNPDLWQERLWEIMEFNIKAIYNMIGYVRSLPKIAQMVRLSSDAFPLFTHPDFSHFYKRKDVERYLEKHLANVRTFAGDVRLSFHPAQFCVLASENPNVVEKSIEEFEYHAYIAELMGYGRKFQDFKCNIHLNGKGGESVFRKTYKRLSAAARNIITVENDEYSSGLDDVLAIADLVPIVLDIHHHWIHSGGYIKPDSKRALQVIESWRGVRPVIHYAYSREEYLVNEKFSRRPTLAKMETDSRKLREHSDQYPNWHSNAWALSFLPSFDIMCEAKHKNIASQQLIDQYLKSISGGRNVNL
jgi:UV DNA damage repair endonuclease